MSRIINILLLVIISTFFACKTNKPAANQLEKKDASLPLGYWNDSDSRISAAELVNKMMNDRWLSEYLNVKKNMRPILIVGLIRNIGQEKIDTNLFTKDIEKSIIKGDLVRFIQSANKKEMLLNDLNINIPYDSVNVITNWASRMGSDFVVMATFNSVSELKRKEKIIHYSVKLELLYCETKQLVWLSEKHVSKRVIIN